MHKQFIVGDRTQTIHFCSPDVSVAILAQVFVWPNFHEHQAVTLLFDHVAIEQDEGFGCHEAHESDEGDEINEGNEGYACEKSLGKICGLEEGGGKSW